jgi:hypothetical protein
MFGELIRKSGFEEPLFGAGTMTRGRDSAQRVIPRARVFQDVLRSVVVGEGSGGRSTRDAGGRPPVCRRFDRVTRGAGGQRLRFRARSMSESSLSGSSEGAHTP